MTPVGLPPAKTSGPWMRTSLTSDASPAFQINAVARWLIAPAHRPTPETIALPPRAQEYGYRGGFALLITLFVFATWNDLSHLQVFRWFASLIG